MRPLREANSSAPSTRGARACVGSDLTGPAVVCGLHEGGLRAQPFTPGRPPSSIATVWSHLFKPRLERPLVDLDPADRL